MKEMVGGCCVCSDERGWDENPLVYCDGHGCNVAVHQACYGIVQVPKGPWFCSKCISQERIARVKCELCPSKEGALKRTDSGGWAHVVCALYIPEVRFGNVATMEPIILASVPHDRYQKTCYICEERGRESKVAHGACMACNKPGCRHAFHVTCAQSSGLLCEESDGTGRPTVKYVGYCLYHWNKKGKGLLMEKSKGKQEKDKKNLPKPKSSPGTIIVPGILKPDTSNNKNSASTPLKDTPSKDVSTPKQRGRKISAAKANSDIPGTPKTQESPKTPLNNASTIPPLQLLATPTVTTAASTGSSTTVTDEALTRGAVAASESFSSVAVINSPSKGVLMSQSRLNTSLLNLPASGFGLTEKCLPLNVNSSPQFSSLLNSSTESEQQQKEQVLKEKTADKEELPSKDVAKEKPAKETAKEKLFPKEKKQVKDKLQQKEKVNGKQKAQIKARQTTSSTTKKRPSKPSEDEPKRKVGRPPKSNTLSINSKPPVSNPNSAATFPHTANTFNTHTPPLQGSNMFQSLVSQSGSSSVSVPTNLQNGVMSPTSVDYVVPQPRNMGATENRKTQNNTPLQLPTSLEQLLEYQWEQGAQFLMQQAAQYDVASLMSSLHQLKADNARLEERLLNLSARRSQLLAVSARLASPMSCTPTSTTTSNTDAASKSKEVTKTSDLSPSLSSNLPGALTSPPKSGQERGATKTITAVSTTQNTSTQRVSSVSLPLQLEKPQLSSKPTSEVNTVTKPNEQSKLQLSTASTVITQAPVPTSRQSPKQSTSKQHIPIKPAPPALVTGQQEKGKQQKQQQSLHLPHSQQLLKHQLQVRQKQQQQQIQLLQQQQVKQPVSVLTVPPPVGSAAMSSTTLQLTPQQFLYQFVPQPDGDVQRLQNQLQNANSAFTQEQPLLNQNVQQQQNSNKQVSASTSLPQQLGQHTISLPYSTAFMAFSEPLSQLTNTQRIDSTMKAAGLSNPVQIMTVDSNLTPKMFDFGSKNESSSGSADKTSRTG